MTNSRQAVFFVALALLRFFCENASGQQVAIPSTANPPVLYLNRANSGQHVAATVGQPIEITLQTIGSGQYDSPQISCWAIRFEGFKKPPCQNPGGPTQVYRFRAAAGGTAQVRIPHTASNPAFTVTIQVGSEASCPSALHPSMMLDQANTAPWKNAWTNMHNDVRQTFTPSLPTLTRVEVELVVGNPGPPDDEVTMMLYNAEGQPLAVVSKTVPVADCCHVLFLLPNDGLRVSPGQLYSIALRSVGTIFGWKYVVGGYANGAASFNGRPLLPGARSTFLFRTFGAN